MFMNYLYTVYCEYTINAPSLLADEINMYVVALTWQMALEKPNTLNK